MKKLFSVVFLESIIYVGFGQQIPHKKSLEITGIESNMKAIYSFENHLGLGYEKGYPRVGINDVILVVAREIPTLHFKKQLLRVLYTSRISTDYKHKV